MKLDRLLLAKLAAVAAVIVGIFLVLGGYGHLEAILAEQGDGAGSLTRLASGGVLLIPGIFNIGLAWFLWQSRSWAYLTALLVTLVAFAYLVYLFITGVPGHPIGLFCGILGAHVGLLLAARPR